MFHLRTYSWLLWLLIQTFFNKFCYYGLKKKPNEQNDDFDEIK